MRTRLFRMSILALTLTLLGGCFSDDDDAGDKAGETTDVDTDDDGWTDDEEIEAGSDPDDPDSTPEDIDGNGVDDVDENDADENDGDTNAPVDADAETPADGEEAASTCRYESWTGCGEVERVNECTNHGDNGPILTTKFGGFSDFFLFFVFGFDLDDDDMVQAVFLDGTVERVSLPVSGATINDLGPDAAFVVPIQEASKKHVFSHLIINGNKVNPEISGDPDFTSGPFTEDGRCDGDLIAAAKSQVKADGTAV